MKCAKSIPVLLFFLCFQTAMAQCKGDFTFKSFPSEKQMATGKIEVTLKNTNPGNYIFKVYKVEGEIQLVQTKEAQSQPKIILEGLPPSNYYIKIEWDGSCQKTIGGIEGIFITEKAPG